MKKIVAYIILLISIFATPKIQAFECMYTSAYVHGVWTNWVTRYSNYEWNDNDICPMALHNSNNTFVGFRFLLDKNIPWDVCFEVIIENYEKTNKKIRKYHQKNDIWYEYSGWVEYYVTDEFPTIEKVLEYYRFPLIPPKGDSIRAKRKAKATIKIAPYKNLPLCFNIYFDKWYFDESIVVK